ncbi:ArsR/SmtB family transcription factor [Nitrosophilus kaiyonis]|uniref:ArsR/SmtB family transcription factor n=1 Tax=Nitrosophilus kaiyonis TaxID=2930200 RepID=UPI0024919F64|nr:metalloregulator ArsR/SmtB family transcription factor [Nitrosophilus kaiyonis]
MKKLVKVAKALGDENRLKVLAFIEKNKEVCVCEVSESLGFSQPLSSKYLKQLKEAGIIDSKKVGKWSIYFIKEENPLIKPFLEELKKVKLPDIKKCLKC